MHKTLINERRAKKNVETFASPSASLSLGLRIDTENHLTVSFCWWNFGMPSTEPNSLNWFPFEKRLVQFQWKGMNGKHEPEIWDSLADASPLIKQIFRFTILLLDSRSRSRHSPDQKNAVKNVGNPCSTILFEIFLKSVSALLAVAVPVVPVENHFYFYSTHFQFIFIGIHSFNRLILRSHSDVNFNTFSLHSATTKNNSTNEWRDGDTASNAQFVHLSSNQFLFLSFGIYFVKLQTQLHIHQQISHYACRVVDEEKFRDFFFRKKRILFHVFVEDQTQTEDCFHRNKNIQYSPFKRFSFFPIRFNWHKWFSHSLLSVLRNLPKLYFLSKILFAISVERGKTGARCVLFYRQSKLNWTLDKNQLTAFAERCVCYYLLSQTQFSLFRWLSSVAYARTHTRSDERMQASEHSTRALKRNKSVRLKMRISWKRTNVPLPMWVCVCVCVQANGREAETEPM